MSDTWQETTARQRHRVPGSGPGQQRLPRSPAPQPQLSARGAAAAVRHHRGPGSRHPCLSALVQGDSGADTGSQRGSLISFLFLCCYGASKTFCNRDFQVSNVHKGRESSVMSPTCTHHPLSTFGSIRWSHIFTWVLNYILPQVGCGKARLACLPGSPTRA